MVKINRTKFLAKKLYNILPPSVIFIGGGLIAFGLTIFDITIISSSTDMVARAGIITNIGILWLVYLMGVATHTTLWTDLEEDPSYPEEK